MQLKSVLSTQNCSPRMLSVLFHVELSRKVHRLSDGWVSFSAQGSSHLQKKFLCEARSSHDSIFPDGRQWWCRTEGLNPGWIARAAERKAFPWGCCPSCKAESSHSCSSDLCLMVGDSGASEHACSCSDLSVLFQVCILGMRKVARMTVKPTKGNFLQTYQASFSS